MSGFRWLALPLCLLAAACGGGDDEDDVGSLSRTEFVEQANRICSKWNEGIRIVYDTLPKQPTTEQYNGYVDVLLLGVRSQQAEIRVLGFPSEADERELEAIFEDTTEVLDRIESKPRLASEPGQFDDVYARLKEYGLTACAR